MSWYKDSEWGKSNDRWYTKFMKGLNWAFNPYHQWFDYDSWNENSTMGKISSFLNNTADALTTAVGQLADPEQLTSLVNTYTGAHLTGSQIEANEMAMQNQEDIYQRQVAGMQKAGLNPALMYESGASSAPAPVQGHTGTASMSELMQAMLLQKQSGLLDAQTRNVDADTDKKKAETAQIELINKYYPNLTQTQIDKMLSDMGLNEEQKKKIQSEIDLNKLDKELKKLDKIIKQAQADESSEFYKATRELEQAKTDREKAEAKAALARAAMDLIEKEYMENTNNKMGSANVVALAAALGTLFSNFHIDFDKDDFVKRFNKKFNDLLDWINKPKKVF